MFVVKMQKGSYPLYLRAAAWTAEAARADKFHTVEGAQIGLEGAAPFMAERLLKFTKIVRVAR